MPTNRSGERRPTEPWWACAPCTLRLRARHGLSLMEVVLALAILGVSLAMIGELIRIGSRAGEAARDDMESQLIAESLINEISSSTQLPEMVIDQPVDDLGEWLYSIEAQAVDEAGLIAIRVTVRKADAVPTTLPPYSLTRWIVDPEVEMAAREAEALMEQQLKERAAAQASGTQVDSGATSGTNQGASGGNPQAPGNPSQGNQNQGNTPNGLPPGFDTSQLPPGFDPKNFDPSQLPPGFDPKNFDPSKLPPGLIPGGRGNRGGGNNGGNRGPGGPNGNNNGPGGRGARGGGPGGGRTGGS